MRVLWERVGLGGPPDGMVPELPSRSILACFSAASACLIAFASRRAPFSCLVLAALSFASAACRCRMVFRGPAGLGGILLVAAALPLSCVVDRLAAWEVVCWEVDGGLVDDLRDPRSGRSNAFRIQLGGPGGCSGYMTMPSCPLICLRDLLRG